MSADCNGHCEDCPYSWCVPVNRARPPKVADRQHWRQDARAELVELADLYGIDPSGVRL
ncbi:hypothetical protein [Streptomyces noursei]|uniref:hypothetical protein n=1 Tax=Streptomyces noursei TaxID=1971 RepID=UPI00167A1E56|nr:hypothetical protein [Streptomyces noursei]MCZ1015601.1 hypothetical protein [Streptomyces noursei]GGW89395.1 hypothetical protein GCM10010341_07740 [Streptomyces noursei]